MSDPPSTAGARGSRRTTAACDPDLVKLLDQLKSGNRRFSGYRDRKSKPRGITVRRCLGKHDAVFQPCQFRFQKGEVGLSRLNEGSGLLELRETTGGLHVADLQIVADMAIGVFVIIAMRQVAELPVEPFVTGVVLAWKAITVTSPIPETFGDGLEFIVVGEDGATFRPSLYGAPGRNSAYPRHRTCLPSDHCRSSQGRRRYPRQARARISCKDP